MKFSKKVVIFCIAVVIIYTIAVLVLMNVFGMPEPTMLTEKVFTYFQIEMIATAFIKVADTAKESLSDKKKSKISSPDGGE